MKRKNPLKNKKTLEKLITILLVVVSIAYIFSPILLKFFLPEHVPYTKFMEYAREKEISSVDINLNKDSFEFTLNDGTTFKTENPRDPNFKSKLLQSDIAVNEVGQATSTFQSLFGTIVYFCFLILVLKSVMKGPSSRIIEYDPKQSKGLNFSSIAGNQELKDDMRFLVDFLKNPKKYNQAGAKLPKGVILYGPPGTGKTLTAKVIAHEAGVPFYSVSGSDFVEMYVGLGAKRVRELFQKAKENSPCIIFIDEIDAVGGKRGNKNSHSEQEQTINALLNEMDGFDGSNNILVIAATNRLDSLDKALIRPGRFDKHIAVELPDANDRLSILKKYMENKRISESVDLHGLSKITTGFSGADLEALINEATIFTIADGRSIVERRDIDRSFTKLITKSDQKKVSTRSKKETEIIAHHEAGHALALKLLTNQEIYKVTILPTTNGIGGFVLDIQEDMSLLSKSNIINKIKVFYAGRVGEALLLKDENEITIGASNDIEKATDLIRTYIQDLGMLDEVGMVKISRLTNEPPKFLVEEAIALAKTIYKEIYDLLRENEGLLNRIAEELIERETLTGKELNEIIENYNS